MIVERRECEIEAAAASIFRAFSRIGGKRGWLYMNWAWRLRGAFDRVLGGVGMRRGRRDADSLRAGETLDFWRVEAVEPDRMIRFRAEMKVPGKAWLQFEVQATAHARSIAPCADRFLCAQRIVWCLYWYGLYPIHALIFRGMIQQLAAQAQQLQAEEGATSEACRPIAA